MKTTLSFASKHKRERSGEGGGKTGKSLVIVDKPPVCDEVSSIISRLVVHTCEAT